MIVFVIIVLVVILPVYVLYHINIHTNGESESKRNTLSLYMQEKDQPLTVLAIFGGVVFRIYVGYPNIAQNDINRSTLNLTSISIANPTADSFLLSIELLIGSSSSFHPRISAFNSSVSLATAAGVSSPFTTVIVPPLTVANHATLNVSQTVQLAGGGSGFEEYAAAVFSDAEVSINVYGKPNLKEGALPTISVVYNKTVTINGM